jgi:hypothetical protein
MDPQEPRRTPARVRLERGPHPHRELDAVRGLEDVVAEARAAGGQRAAGHGAVEKIPEAGAECGGWRWAEVAGGCGISGGGGGGRFSRCIRCGWSRGGACVSECMCECMASSGAGL